MNNTISAQTRTSSIVGMDNTVNKAGTQSESDTSIVNNAAIFGRNNHIEFQGNISIDQATAVGTSNSIQGTNDTAVGLNNTMLGSNGLAVGGRNTIQVGMNESVALGWENTVGGGQAVAIGAHSAAKAGWSVSLGAYANALGASSIAIGPQTKSDGQSSVAIGLKANATKGFGVAIGGHNTFAGSKANSIGYAANASGDDSVAFGTNSAALSRGSVALGAWSVSDRNSELFGYDPSVNAITTKRDGAWKATWSAVSIGDGTKGQTRQLTNLAAGTADTDAVNVAQLKAARVEINAGDNITVTKRYGTDGHAIYSISGLDGSKIIGGDNISVAESERVQEASKATKDGVVSDNGRTSEMSYVVSSNGGVPEKVVVASTDEHITVSALEAMQDDKKVTTYNLALKTGGTVNEGNEGLVTGRTVYGETRVSRDGNYVKTDRTAGENLSALDRQIRLNTDDISHMRNQVSTLNFEVNRLDNRIDRVGAGAAALAGLHPLEFDRDDKWNFAAGYGHYRGADAVALGAFYWPDEGTMVSVGGSMGGGETMLNVGISMKFGKSSPYSGYSKADLIRTIEEQNGNINRISQENEALKRQMQDVLEQLSALQRLKA